ncbi:MAG TPA: polysaccharide deacetylase family protein [candidate division Zixibacteria bacterium]|nr:polysaccharide deacetylase family protein [candidate division Zixibacteria bacterium]
MMLKVGYLTIDDGPTEDFRNKVDFLIKKQFPAIFFCRGDLLLKRKDDAIYAVKKGFVIGNHSFNHPHFSQISLKECFEQIRNTDEIIEKIYQEADRPRPAKLFRFPYGDKGSGLDAELGWPKDNEKVLFMQGIQNYLKKLGYSQPIFENISYNWYNDAKLHLDIGVYWTYDTCDYLLGSNKSDERFKRGYISLDSLKARMDEDEPEGCCGLNYSKSSDIILMHDYPGIEYAFKPLIEALSAKGIYFKLPIFNF